MASKYLQTEKELQMGEMIEENKKLQQTTQITPKQYEVLKNNIKKEIRCQSYTDIIIFDVSDGCASFRMYHDERNCYVLLLKNSKTKVRKNSFKMARYAD